MTCRIQFRLTAPEQLLLLSNGLLSGSLRREHLAGMAVGVIGAAEHAQQRMCSRKTT